MSWWVRDSVASKSLLNQSHGPSELHLSLSIKPGEPSWGFKPKTWIQQSEIWDLYGFLWFNIPWHRDQHHMGRGIIPEIYGKSTVCRSCPNGNLWISRGSLVYWMVFLILGFFRDSSGILPGFFRDSSGILPGFFRCSLICFSQFSIFEAELAGQWLFSAGKLLNFPSAILDGCSNIGHACPAAPRKRFPSWFTTAGARGRTWCCMLQWHNVTYIYPKRWGQTNTKLELTRTARIARCCSSSIAGLKSRSSRFIVDTSIVLHSIPWVCRPTSDPEVHLGSLIDVGKKSCIKGDITLTYGGNASSNNGWPREAPASIVAQSGP